MKRRRKQAMIGCVVVASVLAALYAVHRAGVDDRAVAATEGNDSTKVTSRSRVERAERGMRATRTERPGQSPQREADTGNEEEVVKTPENEEGDGRPIYTMESLPKESGIYRVQVDGEFLELAVDRPHDVMPAKHEEMVR